MRWTHSLKVKHLIRKADLQLAHQAEIFKLIATIHIHLGKGMPAEGKHHHPDAFVCDMVAVLHAEGSQRCEPGQHAQSAVGEAAFLYIQDAKVLQMPAHARARWCTRHARRQV